MMYRKFFDASIVSLALSSTCVHAAAVMEFPDGAIVKGKAQVAAYAFKSVPPVERQCNGQASSGSFTVTKPVDALTPQLAEAAAGKHGTTVLIDDTNPDGTRIAFQLTNATISGIKPAGSATPMEEVSFNYSKIQWITVSPCKAAAPRRNSNTAGGIGGGGYGGGYGASGRY